MNFQSKDLDIFSKNAVRYVPPTRSAYLGSLSRYKDKLNFLDTSIFSKDSEKILKTFDSPSREEINRGKEADRIRHLAQMQVIISTVRNGLILNLIHSPMFQSHYEHELQRMGVPIVPGIGRGGQSPPSQRLVHLDLKGAPPKISYLKRLLPIFKSLGATGLLLEYEDMFPYTSSLRNLSAKNAYSKSEIKELIRAAESLALSIMPLIQTFGHLEFALKLQDFEHLREVPESPQSICPSLNNSLIFIEEMIAQVVELHQTSSSLNDELQAPNFTHLHIGCDEVFRMGECPKCKSKRNDELFLSHVRTVANIIKKRWPHMKIVIWDDMLRTISLKDLQNSKIGQLVEPMVWVYAEV